MSRTRIQTGNVFSFLTAICESKVVKLPKETRVYWLFCCQCGNDKEINVRSVLTGITKSCGCYRKLTSRKSFKNPGETSFNHLFAACKKSAIERGLGFDLTKEQHKDLVQRDCIYCGATPRPFNTYVKQNGKPRYNDDNKVSKEAEGRAWIMQNGIDRVDPLIGYTHSNCVPCCSVCNEMKMDRTESEFIEHIKRIFVFQETEL